jgi:hypothetical protein
VFQTLHGLLQTGIPKGSSISSISSISNVFFRVGHRSMEDFMRADGPDGVFGSRENASQKVFAQDLAG